MYRDREEQPYKLLLPEDDNGLLKLGALVLLLLQLLEVVSSTRLKIDTGVDGRASGKSTGSDHHHDHGSMFRRMTIARRAAAEAVGAPNLDDVEILLGVKAEFRNGGEVLADWKNSSAKTACNWTAVTCGGPTADRVVKLSLGDMNLIGSVPPSIGRLEYLQHLNLSYNDLTGSIPSSLGNCTHLVYLNLGRNQLEGEIPYWKLTQLQLLDLTGNQLTGPIPDSVGSLSSLWHLGLGGNFLEGSFPSVTSLDVSSNRFRGTIPSLANMTSLSYLNLSWNLFSGGLTEGGLLNLPGDNLVIADLSHNKFSGPLAPQLSSFKALKHLDLSVNLFSGTIPQELSQLEGLIFFNVSRNLFSGGLTEGGRLNLPGDNLVIADLSHNGFSGPLAPQLSSFKALKHLDLSVNFFSGTIPQQLSQLEGLIFFNVSYNKLEGPVPTTGVFLRMNLTGAFLGNPDLCGSAINKTCSSKPSSKPLQGRKPSRPCKGFQCTGVLIGVILAGSALPLLMLSSLLCFSYEKCFRAAPSRVDAAISLNFLQSSKVLKLSAEDLKRATDDFSSEYLIGEGAGTKVYKFVLPERDQMYAAKVLHTGPSSEKYEKLLIEEIRALSKLRHRNVLRVVGFCSDEKVKAAILDYMPNGNLHSHLHGDPARQNLRWETRLNIALGIAQGLVYLHIEFPEPIIHRDLKPMNVLLDSDLEPKICDLGLVKFVYHHEAGEASATTLCGTIGYIPPEYTTSTRVSTKGDVYAYGIIILELLTGRQPTENSFGETEDIVAWAQQASSASIVDILDPALVPYGTDGGLQMQQETLLLQVALLCCQLHPQSRPSMRDVLGMLLQIKESSSKAQNTPSGLSHSEQAT